MNEYNILPVNFIKDAGKAFLDSPEMYLKFHLEGWTDFVPAGYAQIEKTFKIDREYAELKVGIPSRVVARKAISVSRNFSCKLSQLQPEIIAMCSNGYVDSTDPTKIRVLWGTEVLPALYASIILKGKTEDGKELELYLRKLLVTPESFELLLGGSEFASIDFGGEAIEDVYPLESNFELPLMTSVVSIGALDESSLILMADTTGFEVGMIVCSSDKGVINSKITAIEENVSITIDKASTTTETGVAIKAYHEEKIKKDNVAYMLIGA